MSHILDTDISFQSKLRVTILNTELKLRRGQCFEVGHRFTSVSSGGTKEFVLIAPSGNITGNKINLQTILLGADQPSWFNLYSNSTIDSFGSGITPHNRIVGSNVSSDSQLRINGTYTPDRLIEKSIIPPNAGLVSIGSGKNIPHLIINGDNNIHVTITNKASDDNGSDANIAFRLFWWEA